MQENQRQFDRRGFDPREIGGYNIKKGMPYSADDTELVANRPYTEASFKSREAPIKGELKHERAPERGALNLDDNGAYALDEPLPPLRRGSRDRAREAWGIPQGKQKPLLRQDEFKQQNPELAGYKQNFLDARSFYRGELGQGYFNQGEGELLRHQVPKHARAGVLGALEMVDGLDTRELKTDMHLRTPTSYEGEKLVSDRQGRLVDPRIADHNLSRADFAKRKEAAKDAKRLTFGNNQVTSQVIDNFDSAEHENQNMVYQEYEAMNDKGKHYPQYYEAVTDRLKYGMRQSHNPRGYIAHEYEHSLYPGDIPTPPATPRLSAERSAPSTPQRSPQRTPSTLSRSNSVNSVSSNEYPTLAELERGNLPILGREARAGLVSGVPGFRLNDIGDSNPASAETTPSSSRQASRENSLTRNGRTLREAYPELTTRAQRQEARRKERLKEREEDLKGVSPEDVTRGAPNISKKLKGAEAVVPKDTHRRQLLQQSELNHALDDTIQSKKGAQTPQENNNIYLQERLYLREAYSVEQVKKIRLHRCF